MSARSVYPMMAHFSCEPVFIPDEEILCPGSEDEDSPEVCRERRKRREAIARDLLKNFTPPVMLSASLRGPFENGWVNPWATSSRGVGAEDRSSGYAGKRRRVVEDSSKKLPIEYRRRTSSTELAIYNTSPTPVRRNPQPSRSAPPFDLTPINTRKSTNQPAKNVPEFERPPATSRISVSNLLIDPVIPEPESQESTRARISVSNLLVGPEIPEPGSQESTRARMALGRITHTGAQYQKANGITGHYKSPSNPSSASSSSFPRNEHVLDQVSEYVQNEAPARAVRRVSFTGSGNVKKVGSWGSTNEKTRSSPDNFRAKCYDGGNKGYRDRFLSTDDPFVTSNRYANQPSHQSDNPSRTSNRQANQPSHESDVQPDAQIISGGPGTAGAGASTDLLETDRYVLNQQDSYADFSTQAAFRKAHQSFTRDLVRKPSDEGRPNGFHAIESESPEAAPQAKRRRIMAGSPAGSPAAGASLFDSNEQDPMSTQAMVDEFSPFAMTTAKKKHTVSGPSEAYMNDLPALTSPLAHRRGSMNANHRNSSFSDMGGQSAPRHRTSHSPQNPVIPTDFTNSYRSVSPLSPIRGPSPDPSLRSPHHTSPSTPKNSPPNSAHREYMHHCYPTSPTASYENSSPSGKSLRDECESPSPSSHLVRNNAPSPLDIPVSDPANRFPTAHANSHSHSLLSFSIAPNKNALTQTSYHQDGQVLQQHDVPIFLSSPETTAGEQFSIDAALDEAESFLGNWDVEAEAKKEGEKAAASAAAAVTAKATAKAAAVGTTSAPATTAADTSPALAAPSSQRRRITQSLGIDSESSFESERKFREEIEAKKRRLMVGMKKYK